MNKKLFKLCAQEVRETPYKEYQDEVFRAMCGVLRKISKRFNQDKFRKACMP
jgi:hypothetical protein